MAATVVLIELVREEKDMKYLVQNSDVVVRIFGLRAQALGPNRPGVMV